MVKIFEKIYYKDIYKEALKVFFEWKKEVGAESGVTIRGIGGLYEQWLNRKISTAFDPQKKRKNRIS